MEHSRRGRAIEHELQRFKALIDGLPVSEGISDVLLSEASSSVNVSPDAFISSNPSVSERCVSIFSTLFIEVNSLVNEAMEIHIPALLLFAEDAALVVSDESLAIGMTTSFVPSLHSISSFLSRVNQVFRSLLQQIRAFHQLQKSVLSVANDCLLTRAWINLGELLSILVQIDEVCTRRPVIRQMWKIYMRALETAEHNPTQFGASAEQFRPLLSQLAMIEGHVMTGNGLRNCYEQSFGDLDDDLAFATRMYNVLSTLYAKWEKAAAEDIPEKKRLMVIVTLTVFYHLHFPKPNKKLIKNVWNSHKKVVVFHLVGDILWSPCHFLLKEVSDMKNIVDKKSQQFINDYKNGMNDIAMLDEAMTMLPEVAEWELSLKDEVKKCTTADAATSLKVAELILKGARLADTISRMLKTILNCREGALRLSKKDTVKVFSIVESVKSISIILKRNWRFLEECVQLACQQWRCHLITLLDKVRGILREANDAQRFPILQVAVSAMLSTVSRNRLTVCVAALEIAYFEKLLRSADVTQIDGLLSRLFTLCEPEKLIQRVSDCGYLFFHRSLNEIFWETFLERMPSKPSIEFFTAALSDCVLYSTKAKHRVVDDDKISDFIWKTMKSGFLLPLCANVENDLRVLTHKHLVVDERDKTPPENSDFYIRIVKGDPIAIYDKVVDVKEFIANYLEKTFYNLSAVALHDFDTYSRMASMARTRYGLVLTAGDLPPCCIDQGLDVVHVIRSLHHFVSHYNYCINQQFFIEKCSSNRTLRAVTSDHMSSSLRTHGIGILNTSVNIVYQLLRKKFAILSQFLADEHIRAQLQRDQRYFEENRDALKQMYPVKRAERFNRALAKLDAGDGGGSFMDKFRELVTQIGNAISFVRSMTSAASAISWQVKAYTGGEMDLREEIGSEDSETTTLNDVLNDIREQSSRNRNYIKMLLDVFRTGFSDPEKFSHMQLFHVLVPSLTLNYLEHMLTCRERLKKRTFGADREMTFVDDGFVMGVAYLLAVLSQWRAFNLLGWMSSLRKKLDEEVSEVKTELEQAKDKRSEKLRIGRIDEYTREYQQMIFSFQSARVFFSYDDYDE